MKFSIVTVCLNVENEIENTIESVLNQEFKNYEYIIIDGGSKDSTYDIVKSYQRKFSDIGVNYIISSEPDKGIYDAMNKGIDRAFGEWILFLNAGDTFYNGTILSKVSNEKLSDVDVVYGDTINKCSDYYRLSVSTGMGIISKGMPFCHQSAFIKTNLMKKMKYYLSYKICADYNFVYEAYLDNKKFMHIELPISVFSVEGISHSYKYFYLTKIETLKIRYLHNGIGFFTYHIFKFSAFLNKLLAIVKRFLLRLFRLKNRRETFYLYDSNWVKGLDNISF